MSDPPPTTESSRRAFSWTREGMPGWIPRLLLMVVLTAALAMFAFTVLRELRSLIVLFFISLFLSVALEPGVHWLASKGLRRGAATGGMFLAILGVAGTFIGLMIPLIIDQTLLLVEKAPDYVDQLGDFTERFGVEISSQRLRNALANIDSSLQDIAADVAGSVFGVGSRLIGTIFQLLTIALFTFYLTADGPRFRRAVLSALSPDRQREVLRAWDIAIEKTGGYFYSRALLAGLAALVTWIVLRLLGVPFALPLALWVGVLSQFVPVIGTYLGGALPILIALLENPAKALGVLIFIVVYQQVENYLISPKITARTMSLHPAVSFGSAIAGGTLLGAPGALMALPTAATIQAFLSTYIRRHDVVDSDHVATDSLSE